MQAKTVNCLATAAIRELSEIVKTNKDELFDYSQKEKLTTNLTAFGHLETILQILAQSAQIEIEGEFDNEKRNN